MLRYGIRYEKYGVSDDGPKLFSDTKRLVKLLQSDQKILQRRFICI